DRNVTGVQTCALPIFMVFLNGDAIVEPDYRGQKIEDDSFILMFNAHHEAIDFTLPPEHFGMKWKLLVDTTEAIGYPLEELTIEEIGRASWREGVERRA